MGSRVWGEGELEFGVEGLRFRVQGGGSLGFRRVEGSGRSIFRVWASDSARADQENLGGGSRTHSRGGSVTAITQDCWGDLAIFAPPRGP